MENSEEPLVSGENTSRQEEIPAGEDLPSLELVTVKDKSPSSDSVDSRGDCSTSRERSVRRYPRGDLEALRFVGADEQKKWREVCQGLESRVFLDYDEPVENNQKNMDRKNESRRSRARKKALVVGKSESIMEQIKGIPAGEDSPSLDFVTVKDNSPSSGSIDSRGDCSTSRERSVRRYPRGDLEALRFVGPDEQKKKWGEVCQGLESRILLEYDELVENDQKKMDRKNESRRLQERKIEPAVGKSESIMEQIKEYCGAADQSGSAPGGIWNEERTVSVDDEHDDYDSDDDDYDSIQRPAFAVDGEPDYESGPPQDGWEYLRRVRWEASQMPKVKIAKVDRGKWSSEQTPYMPKIPDIAKCPEDLRPSKTWMDQFLADFCDLRKAFSELEISPDHINLASAATDEEDPENLLLKKTCPTLSVILNMDPVARAANLRNRVKAFESMGSLSQNDSLWIFALCAAVDAPLDAEMGSCLRRMLRKSSSLLAKKTDPSDEEVARLNILIAISGKFFGQSEEN